MTEFKLLELDYSNKLIEQYCNLADLPGFVLLESADHTKGRYDILSAFPYDEFAIHPSTKCTAQIYSELQDRIPLRSSPIDLPFQGGAIGYFSYDFAARLAGIDKPAQSSLETLALVEMGLYDWAIISDHHLRKVYLFAANTQPTTAEVVKEVLQLWQSTQAKVKPFSLKEPFRSLITKDEYQQAFNAILDDLKRGRSYQVNYTQPFNAAFAGDTWTMYQQIRSQNPVPFSAFLRRATTDILSFSPERFLMMDKRQLLTSPIKGTEKRSANLLEDAILRQSLLASEKNRAENIMIVDLLRNDLGKIAKTGSVGVQALCQVESYQAVHHLVSHVVGICRDNLSSMDAFSACFPGGSITGAPKLEAMHIIAEHEAYARGLYCGSLGYFSSHGRFDTNIAIRTVVAREEILHMAAGGGIVIDSNGEDEYQECFTKIAAIVNGLN